MRLETYRLKEQLSLVITFALGISFLLVSQLPLLEANWELGSHLLRDLGIALLIGGYITITIERSNKLRIREEVNEYIKEVGDSFIKAVYGKALPKEVFEVVKNLIFEKSFIRTACWNQIYLYDFNSRYIETVPQNIKVLLDKFIEDTKDNSEMCKNRIICKITVRYKVMNVSALKMNYAIVFGFEKPLGGKYEGLCGITSVVVNRQELISQEGYFSSQDGTTIEASNEVSLGFKHDVEIPSSESAEVAIEAYFLSNNEGSQSWFSADIQKGATLSVVDAEGNKDISIRFGVPHLMEPRHTAKKNPRTNTATFETSQYLLPGQGFEIHWMPDPMHNNS